MKRFLVLIATGIAALLSMSAQTPIPMDPAVRKGQLDNGLTYYIRHNAQPEGRAEFHLATHAGAIQEAPDQDGLAHFLEHMCFNGLKNLPGKQMLEYLQSIGAQFGRNINASTGVEQTTYMLNNIPVSREGIVDTCLLVLHDWSHFVTCDPVEIDKERGVIIEEKRQGNNFQRRMSEQLRKCVFGDSKYADCTVIGSFENLENFKPESLTNFYHTWYRPDLQAVIVVGDIDPDQVEAKLKDLFKDIPAVKNPQPRVMPLVPDNEEPVIGIITDPEATGTNVQIYWKSEPDPVELNSTAEGFMFSTIKDVISLIMDERLSDIASQPNAPFMGAGFSLTKLCETCDVVQGALACGNGEAMTAFKALFTEIEKMARFGFTDAEVQRAKDNILREYEQRVEGADTRKNSEFVSVYKNNFFNNAPCATPEIENQLAQMICANITADLLNQLAAQIITRDNIVIAYLAPEKEGLVHPSEADFLAAMEEVRNSDIQANAGEEAGEELLDPSKLKGSKVKTETKGIHGSTEWTLKNGVKVIVLPTEYKKDQVLISLEKDGGLSLVADEDLFSFEDNVIGLFWSNSGVSRFPQSQLKKMLAGKSVSVYPGISSLKHGISATTSPKDIETAMQLLYLRFVEPRFDQDEFNVGANQLRTIFPNVKTNPDFILEEKVNSTIFGGNHRAVHISDESLAKASIESVERAYRQLFKDAAGAKVYIVGNVDLETLRPMVEKYLGSLPKGKKAASYIAENDPRPVKGKKENIFEVDMQTPKSSVVQVWTADIAYTTEKAIALDAVQYILRMIYTETLREEEGGTYGASVQLELSRIPEGFAGITVNFDTNAEQAPRLRELAVEGLEKLAKNGPTEEQFTRTVENFKKNIPERRITNNYWLGVLRTRQDFGEDEDADYAKAVAGLSAAGIQAAAQEILSQGNFIEVVMNPRN